MKRNLSNPDRIVRAILAVVLGYFYFSGIASGVLGIVLLVLSGVLLVTAIVAFCPLYAPFKFSTYKSS